MAAQDNSLEKYFYWFAIIIFIALIGVGAYIYINNKDEYNNSTEVVDKEDVTDKEEITGEGVTFIDDEIVIDEEDDSTNDVTVFNLNDTSNSSGDNQSEVEDTGGNTPGKTFVNSGFNSEFISQEIESMVLGTDISVPEISEYNQSQRYSNIASVNVKVNRPAGVDESILSLVSYQSQFCEYDENGVCGSWIDYYTQYGYSFFGSNLVKNSDCGVECERWSNMISKQSLYDIPLTGLRIDTKYNVRVRALLGSKVSYWSQFDNLMTRYRTVSGVKIARDNNENYVVSWNALSDMEDVVSYTIKYCIRNDCDNTEESILADGRNSNRVVLQDVEDNQHYVANVIVNVESPKRNSIQSESVSFITARFNPVVRGNILTWDTVDPLNIYVDYNENQDSSYIPVLYKTEYDVEYLVNYCDDSASICDDNVLGGWKSLPVFNNSVSLQDLVEDKTYEIRMIVIGRERLDDPSNLDPSLWNKYSIVVESSKNDAEDKTRQKIAHNTKRKNSDSIYFYINFQLGNVDDIRYCEYDLGGNCNELSTNNSIAKVDDSVTDLYVLDTKYAVDGNEMSLFKPSMQYAVTNLKPNTEYKISARQDGRWYYLDNIRTISYQYLTYSNNGPIKIEHNINVDGEDIESLVPSFNDVIFEDSRYSYEGRIYLKAIWDLVDKDDNIDGGFEVNNGDIVNSSICSAVLDPALDKVYYCNSQITEQEHTIVKNNLDESTDLVGIEYSIIIPYPRSTSLEDVEYITQLQLNRGNFAPSALFNKVSGI